MDERRERLADGIRRIVRARELAGRGPRWVRAWKRTLWRYAAMLRETRGEAETPDSHEK